MENIPSNDNVKKLKLRAGEYIDNETIWSLRGTKALVLETIINTDEEYNNRKDWYQLVEETKRKKSWASPITRTEVTTWASLVRNAIDILKPRLDFVQEIVNPDEFIAVFNDCLVNILNKQEFKLNTNCPKRLYKEAEETDLVKSNVYRSNKNHFIPIVTDEFGIVWGICAVYTGEVIIMLEALLDTIHYMIAEYRPYMLDKEPFHTIVITYKAREDLTEEEIKEQVAEIDTELQNLEMSKDLLKLQGKVAQINSLTMELFNDIENIQNKYGLKTLNDLFKSAE